MAQITAGIKSILSNPSVYSFLQNILGAKGFRQEFVEKYLRPFPGQRIIDIGCGPCDIIKHLPEVDYLGFDVSEKYIQAARRHFGSRGTFECKNINNVDSNSIPNADLVMSMFLIHHLEDEEALQMFNLAKKLCRKNGRVLTVDPCLEDGQAKFARYLIMNDRGQNVRTPEGYRSIASQIFRNVHIKVRHDMLRLPYTHIIMECSM